MVFSNVIINVTICSRSFVSGRSRANVSAGFTNVSGDVYDPLLVIWGSGGGGGGGRGAEATLTTVQSFFSIPISVNMEKFGNRLCLEYCYTLTHNRSDWVYNLVVIKSLDLAL